MHGKWWRSEHVLEYQCRRIKLVLEDREESRKSEGRWWRISNRSSITSVCYKYTGQPHQRPSPPTHTHDIFSPGAPAEYHRVKSFPIHSTLTNYFPLRREGRTTSCALYLPVSYFKAPYVLPADVDVCVRYRFLQRGPTNMQPQFEIWQGCDSVGEFWRALITSHYAE